MLRTTAFAALAIYAGAAQAALITNTTDPGRSFAARVEHKATTPSTPAVVFAQLIPDYVLRDAEIDSDVDWAFYW